MEYTVKKPSKTEVEISFEVPKGEWIEDIKNSYTKNKYKYALKGFRKGKVPFSMAFESFKVDIYNDALSYAVPKYIDEIVEKDNLELIGEPDYDVEVINDDELKMTVKSAVKPEFELGQYKGLDIEKFDTEVSEEEINEEINKELTSRARLVDVERAVKDGDSVVIDFSGSVDGEKFEGGTAEKHSLVIGSKQFIPGFEEQLIGMTKGEEKDIEVTFPKDYAENLAGKKAVFAIKLHEVKEKELPKLDDEFVKDISDTLNNVDEYKESIKQKLYEGKERQAENDFANKVMESILGKTEIELPDCMIEESLNHKIQQLERNLASYYGIRLEDYVQYTGKSIEEIRQEKKEEAVRDVKYELIITEIIKQEKIEFSKEEFEEEIKKIPAEQQKSQEAVNYTINALLTKKLFDFLKENNNLK